VIHAPAARRDAFVAPAKDRVTRQRLGRSSLDAEAQARYLASTTVRALHRPAGQRVQGGKASTSSPSPSSGSRCATASSTACPTNPAGCGWSRTCVAPVGTRCRWSSTAPTQAAGRRMDAPVPPQRRQHNTVEILPTTDELRAEGRSPL